MLFVHLARLPHGSVFMVRRRSTVRFRNWAPAQRDFSNASNSPGGHSGAKFKPRGATRGIGQPLSCLIQFESGVADCDRVKAVGSSRPAADAFPLGFATAGDLLDGQAIAQSS